LFLRDKCSRHESQANTRILVTPGKEVFPNSAAKRVRCMQSPERRQGGFHVQMHESLHFLHRALRVCAAAARQGNLIGSLETFAPNKLRDCKIVLLVFHDWAFSHERYPK